MLIYSNNSKSNSNVRSALLSLPPQMERKSAGTQPLCLTMASDLRGNVRKTTTRTRYKYGLGILNSLSDQQTKYLQEKKENS